MRICKKCILPDNFKNTTFNEEGICNYCQSNITISKKVNISEEFKKEKSAEIERIISEQKGKAQYDCVVGFSGGKDSAYLLWKLKNEYNLNILAVVVDHGFFPEVTTKNIDIVQRKLEIDVLKYTINSGFMERFFKYKFENYSTKAIFDNVCADCSNILEGNVIKIAAQMNIPLVFIGLSPEQVNRYVYEIPRDHLLESWEMDVFSDEKFFKKNDGCYSWRGLEAQGCDSIKVILPYHVWDYDEEEIVKTLEREDILPSKNSNPMMTRCKILDTMCYLDKNRIGYDGFIAPFSDLIRMGKAPRQKYYDLFYTDYKTNEEHVNEVIDRLDLNMQELIEK